MQMAGAATGAGLVGWRVPATASPGGQGYLTPAEVTTLNAALARMVPASGPGDWSAADLGVATYIENILSASPGDGSAPVFAGGPYRSEFAEFQHLSRVKAIGWRAQVDRWRDLYKSGLAALDEAAGGNFAAAPAMEQDAVLAALDTAGDPFFAVLYDHTMEGTYSHPAYGGNAGYRSWQSVGFAGDVHGVRFPGPQFSRGAWNVYGGYAPEEIIAIGTASTEQPVASSTPGGHT
jgi:hypothetical protein